MLFFNQLFISLAVLLQPLAYIPPPEPQKPAFLNETASAWADSVMSRMSTREKIGQLFMIAAYPEENTAHHKELKRLIREYHVGGLILFKSHPHSFFRMREEAQKVSRLPLLIAIDGEWGLSMRVDSAQRWPRQMTLGAINDEQLIYEFGREVAREMKRMGVHINFAPVIDVNNNPANPVINTRSFGDQREEVARRGIQYMKGMQEENVLACGKHFPGHGNTSVDSHYELPQLNQTIEELDSIEMYPFRELIHEGLGSVMVAHLNIPAMDKRRRRPSTLSEAIIKGWLRDSMNFEGLVFTDALNMKAVSKYYQPGELEMEALVAGNDVLLFPEDVPAAVAHLEKALSDSSISINTIDNSVRKILMLKHWAVPAQMPGKSGLIRDINKVHSALLKEKLYRSAITLLQNKDSVLPLNPQQKVAALAVGKKSSNVFQSVLQDLGKVDTYNTGKTNSAEQITALKQKLNSYDHIILSFHDVSTSASRKFNMNESKEALLKALLSTGKKISCVVFGNPYSLDKLPSFADVDALLLAYEEKLPCQYYAARMIYGLDAPIGKLPVQLELCERGRSVTYEAHRDELNFLRTEHKRLIPGSFAEVDSIINAAIDSAAMPGCQLLIAQNAEVILHKTYGYHTYDKKRAVHVDDIYDIASITKITATALAMMKLYEQGKINLDERISFYLPELKQTDKKNIVIRDMLAHQAQLWPWIPFWMETLDEDGNLLDSIYSDSGGDDKYMIHESLYIKKSFEAEIWKMIMDSKLRDEKEYKYSDLGLIIARKIVERVSGQNFEEFLNENFYNALALDRFLFRPKSKYSTDSIVPTELDSFFRNTLVHGFVHDPGAAMTNGVDGHAGLFANSKSLAIVMQMLLQGGVYNGNEYLKASTINLFTTQQFPDDENRRGLIFDKAQPDTSEVGPTTYDATLSSYGHSGFTGAYTWADPDNQLLIVFLTNRIHPDASNGKLIKWDVRTKVQQAIYDAMGRGRYKEEQKHF